ncbi:tetratricopeptide repeat protein [Viscerimonas tarda]
MKRNIVVLLFFLVTMALSAQKAVRDSIRSGNKAYTEQRYRVAESNYKAAIAKDPTSKEAVYNLGNAYYKQNNWDEAIKEYQQYLNVETGNANNMSAAWHNVGTTMLKKKDLQQSADAYKKALRLNPKDEQTRYNLAVVQKMIQDQKDKDKDKDQDKDKQDQQDKQDQNKDQQQNQDKQDQKEKKPEKQENEQMSRESANQVLKAIEQDEKETQEKVKQMKAAEKKKQNEDNRRQNKDW